MSKNIYRPKKISGFPEWLPEQRIIELKWIDTIRSVFESYGFCSIETPAVEELEVLLAKGETDKEIYKIDRIHKEENDVSDSRLGLHYDLTVPLARYISQHFDNLAFPFKRYQIQKVWRGERPQEGRFREFYQCDIDVVNPKNLSIQFDAEIPAIMYSLLSRLSIGDFFISISNRKILEGFLLAIDIKDIQPVVRIIDKLDKIGEDGVRRELLDNLKMSPEAAEKCIMISRIKTTDCSFIEKVTSLNINNSVLSDGIKELEYVMNYLTCLPSGKVIADLSIARGFDYYTGTIYEARLTNSPDYGAICSGGRYDNLCGSFINQEVPGVGMSIGLSRIISKIFKDNDLHNLPKSPTQVLVIIPNKTMAQVALTTANTLRARGLNVECYHEISKLSKQLEYANKKRIPYVWFPPFDENGIHEIKNMKSGIQNVVNPDNWTID